MLKRNKTKLKWSEMNKKQRVFYVLDWVMRGILIVCAFLFIIATISTCAGYNDSDQQQSYAYADDSYWSNDTFNLNPSVYYLDLSVYYSPSYAISSGSVSYDVDYIWNGYYCDSISFSGNSLSSFTVTVHYWNMGSSGLSEVIYSNGVLNCTESDSGYRTIILIGPTCPLSVAAWLDSTGTYYSDLYGDDLSYGLGYDSGYDEGYQAGYEAGLSANSESAYNEGYEAGFTAGYDDGYADGEDEGYVDGVSFGYDLGYNDGYSEGLADGGGDGTYSEGYNVGYGQGYNVGVSAGIDQGYDEGYSDGVNSGIVQGYENGYDDGYDIGYDDGNSLGYDEGYASGQTVGYDQGFADAGGGGFSWLIGSVQEFLNTPFFGSFGIGTLLYIALGITFVMLFLKFFAK